MKPVFVCVKLTRLECRTSDSEVLLLGGTSVKLRYRSFDTPWHGEIKTHKF